jgi:hypothetical protein
MLDMFYFSGQWGIWSGSFLNDKPKISLKRINAREFLNYFCLDSHCGEASPGPVHIEEVRAEGGRPRQGTATLQLHVTDILSPDMSVLIHHSSLPVLKQK